jgi:hypothetical protein
MAPSHFSDLDGQRILQDFMKQHLGISPTTPLADCKLEVIRAAGRVAGGLYAAVLECAAEEARNRSNTVGMASKPSQIKHQSAFGRPPPSGPASHLALTKSSAPKVSHPAVVRPRPQYVHPDSLRRILDDTIM